MDKFDELLEKDKCLYSSLYLDINNAIDKIEPFIDKSQINKRFFFKNKDLLREYLDILIAAEKDVNSKSFFKKSATKNTNLKLIESYKSKHLNTFKTLKQCTDCKCFSCIDNCKFDSCDSCINEGRIVSCDKTRTSVSIFDNTYKIDLRNNDTNSIEYFNVLGIVQDIKNDQRYILMENINTNQKMVMYLNYTVRGQEYGEIKNGEDFDYAIESYENSII